MMEMEKCRDFLICWKFSALLVIPYGNKSFARDMISLRLLSAATDFIPNLTIAPAVLQSISI